MLSELFRGDAKLDRCSVNDASHVLEGAIGDHVQKIQTALFVIDDLHIERNELSRKRYGKSTSGAVLAFKKKRKIINYRYQTHEDNIVGKMTIAALDKELLSLQGPAIGEESNYCGNDPRPGAAASAASPTPGKSTQTEFMTTDVNGPGAPASPKDVALTRAPVARTVVRKTRALLSALIAFQPGPQGFLSQGIRKGFDMVWAHFGIPKNMPFTPFKRSVVSSLQDFLRLIDQVYNQMETNLAQSSGIFFDSPGQLYGRSTGAFTLSPTVPRVPQVATSPDGIYFNPAFLKFGGTSVGPRKQVEIVIHESAHFPNNTCDIEDLEEPGTAGYGNGEAQRLVNNAWSYGQFALNVVFRRALPFENDE